MFIRLWLAGFLLLGFILLSGSASAGPSTIEGTVKDPNGRPIKGAEVQIEGKTDSSWNKVVKTDEKGRYVSSGLPAGTYKVTLIVSGSVKASINNTTTKSGKSTELNFDLKPATASKKASSGKKGKHLVWVPARTGSHLGGGWVEVDDQGSAVGAERVETASGEALRKLQGTMANPNNASGRPGGR